MLSGRWFKPAQPTAPPCLQSTWISFHQSVWIVGCADEKPFLGKQTACARPAGEAVPERGGRMTLACCACSGPPWPGLEEEGDSKDSPRSGSRSLCPAVPASAAGEFLMSTGRRARGTCWLPRRLLGPPSSPAPFLPQADGAGGGGWRERLCSLASGLSCVPPAFAAEGLLPPAN